MENLERRKIVKSVTNIFAVTALVDFAFSFPMIVYLIRTKQFTDTSALIGCMQIMCLLFLSVISAFLILKSKNQYHDRIDAIGAWVIVHFVNIIGNVSIVTFQVRPNPSIILETSLPITLFICWKGLFVLIETIATLTSFYISHKPVTYHHQRETILHRHNLPNETATENNREQNNLNQSNLNDHENRPISVTCNGSNLGQMNHGYGSYPSLSQETDARHSRNCRYEPQSSSNATNHSPLDNMRHSKRKRYSYPSYMFPTEHAITRMLESNNRQDAHVHPFGTENGSLPSKSTNF